MLRVNEVVGNQTEVGIFLSSGMDSRIVFECLLELGKNVTVFSFGDPNSIEKFSRDVNEAQRLAKKFGCRFESVSLLHCDVNDKLKNISQNWTTLRTVRRDFCSTCYTNEPHL